MSERSKLSDFLKEVINWRWDEFVKAEKDPKYSSLEATVFSLVRTCGDGKLPAIKLAIDRVDGKIETPIKVEYPKIFWLYPEADRTEGPTTKELSTPEEIPEIVEEEEEDPDVATMTLRETVALMSDQPRTLPTVISMKRAEVDLADENSKGKGMDEETIPLVKSVIAANLINLASDRNMDAITELFDQIDGKLVETIKIVGDDLYLTSYQEIAPAGAVKNKDGVFQLDASETEELWKNKLSKK